MGTKQATATRKRLDLRSHRTITARETIERVKRLMPKLGITRVANVTGLDRVGIPVTLAIRPNSRSVAVSQGKGRTLDDAKASALMETIEIWHAEHVEKPVLYGSEAELDGRHNIVNTSRLQRMRGSQYNRGDPMLWIEGHDLLSGNPTLVPFEMVHANYTRPIQPLHGVFHASTNGLASGNHRLEAVCHAITELIERDAMTLWHFSKAGAKAESRIDPDTVSDKDCLDLMHRFDQAEIELGLWDVTSDINVPCIMAVIRDRRDPEGHMGLGAGCHLDCTVAIRRAITEAAQTRLNYISGARDDLMLDEYGSDGLREKLKWADDLFAEASTSRVVSEINSRTFNTLEEDLDYLLGQLSSNRIEEVVAVELTREDIGTDVQRVVIPGLEAPHDDPTYAKGERAGSYAT